MKAILVKKMNTVRMFISGSLDTQKAFWLGKKLKELEGSTGVTFYLVDSSTPPAEMGFWGTKIAEVEAEHMDELVSRILNWIETTFQDK